MRPVGRLSMYLQGSLPPGVVYYVSDIHSMSELLEFRKDCAGLSLTC